MTKYNEKLKSFVTENWDRIKKQRKSPKNFWVSDDTKGNFTLSKVQVGNDSETWNLNVLYQMVISGTLSKIQEPEKETSKESKPLKKSKETEDIIKNLSDSLELSKIKETYNRFKTSWIPILKQLLYNSFIEEGGITEDDIIEYKYLTSKEQEIINEDTFNEIIDWIKK